MIINDGNIGKDPNSSTSQDIVQNLAAGEIQRFITVDYVKVWQDRG